MIKPIKPLDDSFYQPIKAAQLDIFNALSIPYKYLGHDEKPLTYREQLKLRIDSGYFSFKAHFIINGIAE